MCKAKIAEKNKCSNCIYALEYVKNEKYDCMFNLKPKINFFTLEQEKEALIWDACWAERENWIK